MRLMMLGALEVGETSGEREDFLLKVHVILYHESWDKNYESSESFKCIR